MRKRSHRAEANVIAAVAALYFLYNAGYWQPLGGGTPGPRFLIPALPFLALGLAPAYRRFPAITLGLAIPSGLAMLVATLTYPLLGDMGTATWVSWLGQGSLEHTLLTAFGVTNAWLAILPVLAALASAVVFAALATPSVRLGGRSRRRCTPCSPGASSRSSARRSPATPSPPSATGRQRSSWWRPAWRPPSSPCSRSAIGSCGRTDPRGSCERSRGSSRGPERRRLVARTSRAAQNWLGRENVGTIGVLRHRWPNNVRSFDVIRPSPLKRPPKDSRRSRRPRCPVAPATVPALRRARRAGAGSCRSRRPWSSRAGARRRRGGGRAVEPLDDPERARARRPCGSRSRSSRARTEFCGCGKSPQ